MTCPFCASPDVADLVQPNAAKHDAVCLDCDRTWRRGGNRRRRKH